LWRENYQRYYKFIDIGGLLMAAFTEIKPDNIKDNIFDMMGRQWMLVTAGNPSAFNTMTASWGGAGILWNKPVTFTFIRPQRYTFNFMEKNDYYTLSFYDEGYRDALNLCGSRSGRDIDKVKATGLTPAFSGDAVYFDEAKLVLVCRKLFAQDFDPASFIDKKILSTYSGDDFQRVFIGEIEKVLAKE
jgi:flavin reductase (DIM6/NTAB) family NADH-FMN oxidoreductase RutF